MVKETFAQIVQNRHEYAQQWKAGTGGKVVGYLCTYVPEYLFHAAGMLPVRIRGSLEPEDITEQHVYSMLCAFCRDMLAEGLKGRYNYLDALALAQGCPHKQHTFDSWRRHLPLERDFWSFIPLALHQPGARTTTYRELKELKRSLEEWTGKPITQEALENTIEVYNTNSRLLKQVYQLRKKDNPPISGAEVLEVAIAGTCMPKEEHNRLLEQLLPELEAQENGGSSETRLLIFGQTDNIELVKFIESTGARVVMDDLCFGWRYFSEEIPSDSDPLMAIAQRYVNRPPCPIKDVVAPRQRPSYILNLVKEYKAQGAIQLRQKFCDPHGYESPIFRRLFQEHGIPFLTLDQDITLPMGQFKTRVEAFLGLITSEV